MIAVPGADVMFVPKSSVSLARGEVVFDDEVSTRLG